MPNFRPAGYSSEEEDDDFGEFSFSGDTKSEKERRAELVAANYKQQLDLNNTPEQRFYNALIRGSIADIIAELDNGTDVNIKITNDYTPLLLASSHANENVVKLLLNRGADPTAHRDGYTPLMACVDCSRFTTNADKVLAVVTALLEYRIDVKSCDRKRRTALMLASQQGFPEVVKLLLPLSRLDGADNQGWTALFYAVNANQPKVVELLIESGADITRTDVRANSVQHYAKINDFTEVDELFPSDENEITVEDIINKNVQLEELYEDLQKNERPLFLTDVALMLYGMQCDDLIPLFQEQKVGLETFLCLDEAQLREMGVKLSFQRDRILKGLYKFHQHPFKQRSLPSIGSEAEFSTYDLLITVTNLVKHFTVMEAAFKYLRKNVPQEEFKEPIMKTIEKTLYKYDCILHTTKLLRKNALKFDLIVPNQPDLITKNSKLSQKNFKLSMLKYFTIFSLSTVSIVCYVRYVH